MICVDVEEAPLRFRLCSTMCETVLQLIGEADVSVEGQLRERLGAALAHRAPSLRVDTSALLFMDCSTLRCFIEAATRARELGISFTLCGVRPMGRRLVRLCDLEDLLMPGDQAPAVRG